MLIIKRDGTKVEFDRNKIINAISAANNEVEDVAERLLDNEIAYIADEVYSELTFHHHTFTVEEIQDMVENYILDLGNYQVAKKYITYRYTRAAARNNYDTFMKAITEKLEARNVQNQNANIDEYSFGGRIGEATDVLMKEYALKYCVSDLARKRHENNEIYIHDLSHYAVGDHNCLTIPFDDLLAKGFKTRQVDIRPAQSVNTAMQLVAVIFQLESLQQYGGVAAGHIDWTMVPYVRKSFYKHFIDGTKWVTRQQKDIQHLNNELSIDADEYKEYDIGAYAYALEQTQKEVYQATEALYHNLNSLQSRSGCQLPFTSLDYGTCTLPEGRMITKALLDVSIKGLGPLHKTSIFPCGIFQCMKGVNRAPGDPNYDLFQLALKSTSLRLYPNYVNCDWTGNAGYDKNDPRTYAATMGCRTMNGWDINGLGQQKDGRGNICPVTIILPTLAMEADCDVEKFMGLLDDRLHDAKDMLIERFEYIAKQSPKSARFLYENNLMAGYVPEEGIRSALKHGTLAVGMLGMAETLQLLIGKNHTTEEGMALAKRICQLYKKRCAEFKDEYKLNFGVYYSPSENLCYTAMSKFKTKYGIIPKVSDHSYFTNSMHIPVWEKVNVFEKIDLEAQLTGYSSAGCITYVELGSSCKNNLEAIETIVNYAMDKDIPYFAINVPNDTCMDCGYTDEINDTCPQCGGHNIQRLRRVTG